MMSTVDLMCIICMLCKVDVISTIDCICTVDVMYSFYLVCTENVMCTYSRWYVCSMCYVYRIFGVYIFCDV